MTDEAKERRIQAVKLADALNAIGSAGLPLQVGSVGAFCS